LAAPPFNLATRTGKLPPMSLLLKRDIPPPVVLASASLPSMVPTVVVAEPAVPSAPLRISDPGPRIPAESSELEPTPAKRNSSGDRSLTRALGLKLGRVVLDAGHGGHDVGTHGPSGLFEKDLVLDVTLRLGALLEVSLVREVVYTRATDVYIPLEERTHIANERKADLFLSIHANSSPIKSAAGVETYYLNFTTSRAALDVAARENASSEHTIFDLKEIVQKIALKDKIDESREFATRLQTSLYGLSSKSTAANTAARNRGIKKAPFVVLIGAHMPSVLAEIGFLTNATDEALLRRPDHRQKIAEALYKGIANYAETLSHPQQVAAKE
jgi:N-acetylmuramoyl-L-alanine amidase